MTTKPERTPLKKSTAPGGVTLQYPIQITKKKSLSQKSKKPLGNPGLNRQSTAKKKRTNTPKVQVTHSIHLNPHIYHSLFF